MKSKTAIWLLVVLLGISAAANAVLLRAYLGMRTRVARQQDDQAVVTVLRNVELLVRLKQNELGDRLAGRWEAEADDAAEYLFRTFDTARSEKDQRDVRTTLGKYILMRQSVPFKPSAFSDWKKTEQKTLDALAATAQSSGAAQRKYLEEAIGRFALVPDEK